MTFKDAFNERLLDGFSAVDIPLGEIMATIVITFLIAVYIFFVYRMITERAFYSKDFNISMVAMAIVTAGIIMAMQSSLVISLGMVGALSIVRFRSAIKEPMDLFFLFWSIGTGIICGAGLYKIAIVLAVSVTVAIAVFKLVPESAGNRMLFVSVSLSGDNTVSAIESELSGLIKEKAAYAKTMSRNVGAGSAELIFEVRSKDEAALVDKLLQLSYVSRVNLVSSDGEFRG